MPIELEFNGTIYELPDEATDEQIKAFVSKLPRESAGPRMEPMASHAPAQPSAPRTWGDEAIDVGKGVGQGLLRLGANMSGMLTGAPAAEFYEPVTRPRNTAQTVGNIVSDIGTAALPMGWVGRAAKVAGKAAELSKLSPTIVRGLVNAAGGAGVAAAQGNDPRAGAAGSVLSDAGMAVASGIARPVARAVTGGGDDIANAALENHALPAMFGLSGPQRAEKRIAQAYNEAQGTLAKPSPRPIGIRMSPGKNMQAAVESFKRPTARASRDAESAVSEVAEQYGRRSVSIPKFLEQSERGRQAVVGSGAPRDVVERAAAADMRDTLASTVPSVAPQMRRMSELAPVVESYANKVSKHGVVDPTGLPGFQAKMAAVTLNRLAAPAAQGLYMAGKLSQSDMARLALMSMLEQSMKDR